VIATSERQQMKGKQKSWQRGINHRDETPFRMAAVRKYFGDSGKQ